MTYTEFKHITYHTPLSEEIREKIAKAYGKNYASVTLEDISIEDAHVLTDLGYNIHHKNNKIEIQL
jgi:ribosomal protein S24E